MKQQVKMTERKNISRSPPLGINTAKSDGRSHMTSEKVMTKNEVHISSFPGVEAQMAHG